MTTITMVDSKPAPGLHQKEDFSALHSFAAALIPVIAVLAAFAFSIDRHKTLLGWDIDGAFLSPFLALDRDE